MNNYLFWDFDGTLGRRVNEFSSSWSTSMLAAVKRQFVDTRITLEDLVPHTRRGFPWHEPEKEHTHLHTAELWWEHTRAIFENIYKGLDFSEEQAIVLALEVQRIYLDLATWELFEDTIPVLSVLQEKGWRHVIISNHVPELGLIAKHLGLDTLIEEVYNSAEIGYEKPHPEIYNRALVKYGHADKLWMIGDNIMADVLGAEQVGIKAILVRRADARAQHQFEDLYGVQEFLI